MVDKTKEILTYVDKAIEVLQYYAEYVKEANPCAYTDRMLEQAIDYTKKIEYLHNLQFSD